MHNTNNENFIDAFIFQIYWWLKMIKCFLFEGVSEYIL